MKILILIFILTLFSEAYGFDLREHAMGDACYFIRRKTMVSLCHPANVAREEDQFFFGNFLFSEGFHQVGNWQKVIDGDASPDQIISLVEDDRVNYIANETELGFTGRSWAITFKPYELWVQTRIQNPAYPYGQIDAGYGQVLGLDIGHYFNDELSIGVKIEAASLKVLEKSFFIPDILVDPTLADLEPEQKNHIVLSPGAAFEPADAWGGARYSVLWKQSYIDSSGILYAGVGFLNEFSYGVLEWGFGAKFRKATPVRPQVFTHYQYERAILTASIATNEQVYGAFWNFYEFETGLSYLVTSRNRVMFFQFGFIL